MKFPMTILLTCVLASGMQKEDPGMQLEIDKDSASFRIVVTPSNHVRSISASELNPYASPLAPSGAYVKVKTSSGALVTFSGEDFYSSATMSSTSTRPRVAGRKKKLPFSSDWYPIDSLFFSIVPVADTKNVDEWRHFMVGYRLQNGENSVSVESDWLPISEKIDEKLRAHTPPSE